MAEIVSKKKKVKARSRNIAQGKWTVPLFLLPTVILMVIVVAYPLFYEVVISFKNVTLFNIASGDYPWYGIKNYTETLFASEFWSTFIRTIIWTVVNIFFHVVIGVFLAMLLNRKLPGKAIFRVLLILPWAIPQYIAALTWKGMFNGEYGAINIALTNLFGDGAAVNWLTDPQMTFIAAIITNIWLGIPFMMMITLGGLQSIPAELYEAADMDGASSWQQFKKITVPLLKPVMTPAIVLGTVWTFNMVNVIYIITSGTASDSSQILVTLVYKKAFEYTRYGQAAALSIIIFIILLLFSNWFMKAQKLED